MKFDEMVGKISPKDGRQIKKLCGMGFVQGLTRFENDEGDDLWIAAVAFVAESKEDSTLKWAEYQERPIIEMLGVDDESEPDDDAEDLS